MKKIGIYDPYLNILGGGERYVLTIAQCLSKNFDVDIFWKDKKILRDAEKKFHLDLSKVQSKRWFSSRVTRANQLRSYDAFFYVTDGSIFFSPAKRNFLIIQSPDKIPQVERFLVKAKLKTWQYTICYSQFMADIIKKRISKNVTPLFVPVDLKLFQSKKKEKIILSVGRFFSNLHAKKQDMLIEAFRRVNTQIPGWKFVVAGSVDPQGESYLQHIKDVAKGLPVEIYTDISFHALARLYDKAAIYWHAAGFREDLVNHPEKAEHFGVTTIEAMAAGAVPIVFGGGGQKEIVQNEKNGFVWKSEDELIEKTIRIIKDKKKHHKISENAIIRAQNYTVDKFCSKVYELVQK